MTMIPEKRRCPCCKKMYYWNPDIGKMTCPKCGFSEFVLDDTNLFEVKVPDKNSVSEVNI